jgi:hypothetical protein
MLGVVPVLVDAMCAEVREELDDLVAALEVGRHRALADRARRARAIVVDYEAQRDAVVAALGIPLQRLELAHVRPSPPRADRPRDHRGRYVAAA